MTGRPRLSRRGGVFLAAALVLFVGAAAASVPALLYPVGLLLALVIFALVVVGTGHRLTDVSRNVSPRVVEPGAPVRVEITVTNTSRWPSPEVTWLERLPRVLSGRASGRLPTLGGFGSRTASAATTYTVSSNTRGVHDIGPLNLTVSDPFGLVTRERPTGGTHTLTVLQHRFSLSRIRPRGRGNDGSTRPAPHNVGVGDDDVIARPYAPGDAMKRLHWKATAHRGELMVRQEEQHVNPRATVVLDLFGLSHGTFKEGREWEHSAGLEWSVSAAASVTEHLVSLGYTVNLVSHDGEVDVELNETSGTMRDALLALAQCTPSEQPIAPVPLEPMVLLVSGRLDLDRAGDWIGKLAGDGHVMAMISSGTGERATEHLLDAGWSLATYDPRSNIPDVWRSLDGSRDHVSL